MLCKHYNDALIEAAASGVTPQRELRAHLAECASCREALAQEQSLFAAIDSGLHAVADMKVPPSLLPRVRAAVDEVAVAPPRWGSTWFALSGAAVAVALVLAVGSRHNNPRTPPTNTATIRPPVEQVIPGRRTPLSSAGLEREDLIPRLPVSVAGNSSSPGGLASSKSMPEVLVPRDQEVLLARYAQQWSSHKRAPLVAQGADEVSVKPLEVAPIQIAQLDVKLLTEDGSK